MIDWILLAIYIVGYLLCWRTASWVIAHDLSFGDPNGGDIVGGMIIGAIVSIFWPVVVPFRVAHAHGWLTAAAKGTHGGFMRPPKVEREKVLRQQIKDREREIKVLEQTMISDGTLAPRTEEEVHLARMGEIRRGMP